MKYSQEQFIQKSQIKHNNKYFYSKSNYTGKRNKIIITCPIHGEFEQKPSDHLIGRGCVKCFLDKKRLSTNQFIQKAIAIHGNKYDYSKVNYINNRTKITIICPIHGEFEQKPNNHIQNKNGCSQCKSSKGELTVKAILEKYNIEIITQYKLPEIVANYEIDFYLPEYNLLIEFHGKQHYEYIPFFHRNGEDSFLAQKNRDDIVRYSARQFGYRYLEFNYKQLKYLSSEQFEKLVINSIKDIKSSIFLSSLEDNHKIRR